MNFWILQVSQYKMSKRVADKYITDRNWDQEDEPEEVCFIYNSVLYTQLDSL